MSLPEKVTFRPGSLSGPMESRMSKDSIGASELIRRALAEYLDRKAPAMPVGNPNFKKVQKRRKRSG